jgi:GT2 family glycosyltransferase
MSPRFSIVTPVYDPPADVLLDTIASVVGQSFGDWELLLVDDASPSEHVWPLLQAAADADPRISALRRSVNGGIVAASNDAIAAAKGEFVVLLDHDDLLELDALAQVDAALHADPEIDYLYTDEDHLAPDGRNVNVFYKPDWSPERLRSQNYCCHLSVMRRSIVDDVGGFHQGFDGSQDYDLILRVTEQARKVHHLPAVLYHWRQIPTSVAADPDAKPYAYEAGRLALQAHCDRLGLDATVELQEPLGTYRVRRHIRDEPLVSVVIPTCGSRGRVWGIERVFVIDAVRSILDTATYRNLQFVVVADDFTPPEVITALERLAGDRLKVVWYHRTFNFSEKINIGRIHADGDLLLLLNDDVEVISPDFIEVMVGLARQPDVGSVGAKLLFSDRTLQHAGHLFNGDMHHVLFKWRSDWYGPHSMLVVDRECIGVTAACLMIRSEVFDDVGGLTMELVSNFNDVDLALKLRQLGYRNVWTPHAALYHFESVTRDPTVTQFERDFIERRWAHALVDDPYYNPNLEGKRNDWLPRGIR